MECAGLCELPNSDEIRVAVWSIGSHKSPSPNGMTGFFFKQYGDIVGVDVTKIVLDFFRRGFMLYALNHSFITLIPKTDHPTEIGHYRPISLCNVAYKIIS